MFALLFMQCRKAEEPGNQAPNSYFPPAHSGEWESIRPSSLNWNENELSSLATFLEQKGTKAFIILKDGRIAVEYYFDGFTPDKSWYWASAGKTLTAALVGIAQHQGKLSINDRTSQYLGTGWTSTSPEKENKITIRHQLAMTTGLDDNVPESDCTSPSCLQYKADAGTRWSYHNAPYTLLEKVLESATGTPYKSYFQQMIGSEIGMDGSWLKSGFNNVFYSTPRSMARFGLLLLNNGRWNGKAILPADFLSAQFASSQNINAAYGYLTWLNGKSSYMLPQTQISFNGFLIPNAPEDTYAALGKNDQKIYVVPSQNLVIIRMGESAGDSRLAASSFDNELWGRLRKALKL